MNYEQEIIELKRRIEELEKLVLGAKPAEKPTLETSRDKTKYMFQGKVYPKNRLVLAIIKNYVEKHSPNFQQLCSVFDKSLQGSLGVVEEYSVANKISDAGKRFFMKDEDVITLSDAKVVVCTQWGIFNIVKFVKQAKALGYDIETI